MRAFLLLCCLVPTSCASPTTCGAPSGIATHAALLTVEVFAASEKCAGSHIASATATPLRIVTFAPSAATPIDLPGGTYVVHVAAYHDNTARILDGEGCAEDVRIAANGTACLPLELIATGADVDGGGADLSSPDLATPPDLSCPTHSNGVGQSYVDCANPTGTATAETAMEACVAHTGSANLCKDQPCSGGVTANAVCTNSGNCICWVYSDAPKGKVFSSPNGGCSCAAGTIDTWN